jgi:hypothetical protein
LADVFKSGARPESFDEAYDMVVRAGLYKSEAKQVWDFIRGHDIRSVVEVGRNLGSGIFLMACAARGLKRFLSVDILRWSLTDDVIPAWAEANGFDIELVACDSMNYEPDRSLKWDFVFIDGGHTGPIVTNDLEKFRGLTRYIGFHDFADRGHRNTHKRLFKDVVEAIAAARDRYGWKQVGLRGRSEIIFDTGGDDAAAH